MGTIGYTDVGIAVDPSNNSVYVTDNAHHKILKFHANGTFVTEWGDQTGSDGDPRYPTDVAVDANGNVFILSEGHVQKFAPDGSYITRWTVVGEQGEIHMGQQGIAVDLGTNEVYVADTGYSRIMRYSNDGTFINSIGSGGSEDGELASPNDLAVAGGHVFVADSFNNRVQKFSSDGTFLAKWETFGTQSDIWNPTGIAIDQSGTVYVSSSAIHKISSEGAYEGVVGANGPEDIFAEYLGGESLDLAIDDVNGYLYSLSTIGNYVVALKFSLVETADDDVEQLVLKWAPENPEEDRLGEIAAMKTDNEGNLYIVDGLFGRIHKYSSEGKFLLNWGLPGWAEGEFDVPSDIAIDSENNVYVVDSNNRRVQKFTANGGFLLQFGGGDINYLSEDGHLGYPHHIAIDSTGTRLFVSDTYNSRISIFDNNGTFIEQWNAAEPDSSPPDSFSENSFHEAAGLAIDSENNIYIWDIKNVADPPYAFSRMAKFDGESKMLVPEWNSDEKILGNSIHGFAIDSEDNLYLTDSDQNMVMKFSSEGAPMAQWGSAGMDSGQFSQPRTITVDPLSGLVYVADAIQSRIQIFAPAESAANIDDRHPSIIVPADGFLEVNATDSVYGYANVTYTVTAVDDHDPAGSIVPLCYPPSGSPFFAGYNNTVSCTATDSAGNTVSKSLIISVIRQPRPQVELPQFQENYTLAFTFGSHVDPNDIFLQPAAVALDKADNAYILTYGTHPIQKYDSDGKPVAEWGEAGTGRGQIAFAAGIAVSDGHLYVTDSESSKVLKFSANGTFLTEWGSPGTGDGQFSYPYGIAVDSDGFVYVGERGNPRIQKFTADGEFVTTWSGSQDLGPNSSEESLLSYPNRIAVMENTDGRFIFVMDAGNAIIQKFTSDGQLVANWTYGPNAEAIAIDANNDVYVSSQSGAGLEKFNKDGDRIATLIDETDPRTGYPLVSYVLDIAIDSSGNIYVVTSGSVMKFDAAGNMLNSIRYTYAAQGNFIDPFRIAVDPTSGQVYVADYANERIQMFDRNGTFLAVIQPGNGSSTREGSVTDIEVNSNGTLYVLAQKVYMFDNMGIYQGEWGRVGDEEGELNGASSMAIDSEGNVYLASGTDYTIKKFTSDGQYLLEWKSDDPIQDPTTASPPSNIAIGPDGRIYVMDTHFARLKVFTSNGEYLYLWNSSLSADDGSTEYYSPFDPSSIMPISVELDGGNNIYISYTGGVIRKFSSNGTFITQIGPEIANETRAWWIPDMAIDNQSGQLYMIDGNNQRIAAFKSDMGIAQIPEFGLLVLPVLVIVGMAVTIVVSRLLTPRFRFTH